MPTRLQSDSGKGWGGFRAGKIAYLLVGEGNGHNGEGGVMLFARQGNGTLQQTSLLGTGGGIISVALHPSDRFAYAVDGGDDAILVDAIDVTGRNYF